MASATSNCSYRLCPTPSSQTMPQAPWQRRVCSGWQQVSSRSTWSDCKSPEMTKSPGLTAGGGRRQALGIRDEIRVGSSHPSACSLLP